MKKLFLPVATLMLLSSISHARTDKSGGFTECTKLAFKHRAISDHIQNLNLLDNGGLITDGIPAERVMRVRVARASLNEAMKRLRAASGHCTDELVEDVEIFTQQVFEDL